jgi:hypothetical protein
VRNTTAQERNEGEKYEEEKQEEKSVVMMMIRQNERLYVSLIFVVPSLCFHCLLNRPYLKIHVLSQSWK